VTPVFNGSTSLRSAAGQLIESTSKSARRKEKMNDAYIEKLYSDVTSLFQLDQIEVKAGKRVTFGELPAEAKTLLIVIPCIWILIGLYSLMTKRKGRKKT
jgi:multiple sugar transport system substrate-binding protein